MDKEGWSAAGEFAAGLPAWSPQGHKAWRQQGPSWWVMELAEGNWTPGSILLCLGHDWDLPQFGFCSPGLLWPQRTGPAHHSFLTSTSSLAFAS